MPSKTATPQTVLKVDVDTYEIIEYAVNAQTFQVRIRFRRGLSQPDGSVAWIDAPEGTIDATPILGVIPGPGETVYAVTKRLLYTQAQAAGIIPAGTVT